MDVCSGGVLYIACLALVTKYIHKSSFSSPFRSDFDFVNAFVIQRDLNEGGVHMYRPLFYVHSLGLELEVEHEFPEQDVSISGSREDTRKVQEMKMKVEKTKTKLAFTVSPMINAVQAQLDEQPSYRCTICHEVIGERRQDGPIENAVMLPCGHIFGRVCISKWLEAASSHQDCPNCRRRMVYAECGHHVRPMEVERKPRVIREEEMPGKCGVCRGGGPGWEVEEKLRLLRTRQEAEEKALVGMRIQLPGFFGAFCRGSILSVERRIEESKAEWRREMEGLYEELRREHMVEW